MDSGRGLVGIEGWRGHEKTTASVEACRGYNKFKGYSIILIVARSIESDDNLTYYSITVFLFRTRLPANQVLCLPMFANLTTC